MTDITIRAACSDDCPTIVDFNCALAEESESKSLDRPTLTAGVESLLADVRKGRYFMACIDGQVVGQLMHTYEWSDWRNGDIWWLQSVYVHPDYRRRGVFRALYDHLCQLAAGDPQVVGVRLYVEDNNARAQQTYRDLGMSRGGYAVMERFLRRAVLKTDEREARR